MHSYYTSQAAMSSLKLLFSFLVLVALLTCQYLTLATAANSKLFREYIGAQFNNVKFSDVPINRNVEFHFILSFAIDYDTTNSPSPTNGKFNVFWDSDNLGPAQVTAIKKQHPNVKVALSLGGDTVRDRSAFFQPSSIASWRANALSSLTQIIKTYHLDGIDVDYEHFKADPETFARCVGWVIQQLKNKKVISFASIAPFDDNEVQNHYLALWRSFGSFIDYVNFQFYAYDRGTTVSQFLGFFNTQSSSYTGAKILTSFSTEAHAGGLLPTNGFFTAVNTLKKQQKLNGIFVWCADDSKGNGFRHEVQSQRILASGN